jgi:UDP-N-acetylglucosamine 2-epimerase
MTIVGTRPEIIRLSRVMAALDEATDHVLVHTGQNHDHELNEIFFEEMELRVPRHYLGAAGETVAETIGTVIMGADRILAEERPEAVLILGDTDSSLAETAVLTSECRRRSTGALPTTRPTSTFPIPR